MISTNSNSFAYNSFAQTHENKVQTFLQLMQEPEVQSVLKVFIDSAIATSELKILKRLAALEQILGLDNYGLNETAAPSLIQRLENIEEKVNNPIISYETILEPPMKPVTKTQKRACALVSKLRQCKKRFLTSSEIVTFLKHEVSEDLRITEDICNPREIKKEVLEKAAELFPDIQLSKKSHGRKEVRIFVT